MTPLLFALVALAGGLGAAARYLLDAFIGARTTRRLPVATVLINVTGSLLIGVIAGAMTGAAAEEWRLVLGTGFLGGYTTFSAASFETVRLLQERRGAAAALNAIGTLLVATAAAAVGLGVGALL